MRRIVIAVALVVVAFAIVLYSRINSNTLPTHTVLAYEFKSGNDATYDVALVVTNTVQSGASAAPSITKVNVATHEKVLSTDANGATVQVTVEQPSVQVDGKTIQASTLRINTAELRINNDGHVEKVRFPGAGASTPISVTTSGGKNDVIQLGSTSGRSSAEPLQNLLTMVQASLPSFPSGDIKVGHTWQRSSVINAPYMVLEAALANSKLDGFEQQNDLRVARIVTQASTPVDVQTYQPNGAALQVKGAQDLRMTAYFVPSLGGVIRVNGVGHVDLAQQFASVPAPKQSGGLTVTQTPAHTVTDLSFTATLRQQQ